MKAFLNIIVGICTVIGGAVLGLCACVLFETDPTFQATTSIMAAFSFVALILFSMWAMMMPQLNEFSSEHYQHHADFPVMRPQTSEKSDIFDDDPQPLRRPAGPIIKPITPQEE